MKIQHTIGATYVINIALFLFALYTSNNISNNENATAMYNVVFSMVIILLSWLLYNHKDMKIKAAQELCILTLAIQICAYIIIF